MEFKVFALLIVAFVGSVSCYSAGAPDSECKSMTPRHHVDAQRSAFPYTIVLSKKVIKAGETIMVTIKGKTADDTIKGFIAQARVGDTPIGTWDASPSAQYAQLKNCGNSKGSSVTHKKIEQGIPSVSFLWTSPRNLSEKARIHVTVARNGGTFWVNEKSDAISVSA